MTLSAEKIFFQFIKMPKNSNPLICSTFLCHFKVIWLDTELVRVINVIDTASNMPNKRCLENKNMSAVASEF